MKLALSPYFVLMLTRFALWGDRAICPFPPTARRVVHHFNFQARLILFPAFRNKVMRYSAMAHVLTAGVNFLFQQIPGMRETAGVAGEVKSPLPTPEEVAELKERIRVSLKEQSMAQVREIVKHPDCAPGTWWWAQGERGPTVSCPKCQALGQLDHTVAPDGLVDPSLACPRESCDFHEKIKLLGWDHGAMDFHR